MRRSTGRILIRDGQNVWCFSKIAMIYCVWAGDLGGGVDLNCFFHDLSIHVDRVLRVTELTFDLHNAALASFENENYLARFAENGQHMIPIFE